MNDNEPNAIFDPHHIAAQEDGFYSINGPKAWLGLALGVALGVAIISSAWRLS